MLVNKTCVACGNQLQASEHVVVVLGIVDTNTVYGAKVFEYCGDRVAHLRCPIVPKPKTYRVALEEEDITEMDAPRKYLSNNYDLYSLLRPLLTGQEKDIKRGFAKVINQHSMENRSDTPDYVLANIAFEAITAFEEAIHERKKHQ